MGKPNFSDEFKRAAVAQTTERGYPVAEVSQRLGVIRTRCMRGSGSWRRSYPAMPPRMPRSAS